MNNSCTASSGETEVPPYMCVIRCMMDDAGSYYCGLQLDFPKSDHVSNSNTIAHVIAFGKTELQELCKPQYAYYL